MVGQQPGEALSRGVAAAAVTAVAGAAAERPLAGEPDAAADPVA